MDTPDRIALHHRIGQDFFRAYRDGWTRKRIQFSDELVIREDALLVAPSIGDGEDFPLGEHLAHSGLTFSDLQTIEWGMFWRKVPDFRAETLDRLMVTEEGLACWWSMTGTTTDGQVINVHEADFFLTDDDGRLIRWEVFLDFKEFGTLVEITAGVDRNDLTWATYLAAVAAFVPECEPYVSVDTYANLRTAGMVPTPV